MRNPTAEAIEHEKLLLSKLKDDWERINRPFVNRDLKISLYTKILELEAEISIMESRFKKGNKARSKFSETAEAVG